MLRFSRLIAMDGNNSLKRLLVAGGRVAADTRVLDSDYFISRSYVDRFAKESTTNTRGPQLPADGTEDISMHDNEAVSGDLIDAITSGGSSGTAAPSTSPLDEVSNPAAADGADLSEGASAEDHARMLRDGCTTNWKAAADDSKKRMWAIFDETGIFSCACRHGFCLWNADMVRSGELYVSIIIPVP